MRSTFKSRVMCCLALAFIAFAGLTVGFNASKAEAATITFNLDVEFSGGTPPEGPAPWLTATFDDHDGSGLVTLTMNTKGLVGFEFVGEWLFNFDDNLEVNVNELTFGWDLGKSDAEASVYQGANSYKADGDGYFDILFDFSQAEAERFGAGETSVYDIEGDGITASSFNYWSSPGGGEGTFFSAAHVQGIGPAGDGGWVGAVPIPTSVLLLASGLVGLVAIKRKKSQSLG